MTDKQIIINGVDVSGCERLIINQTYGYVCNCEEDTHLISSCKNRPNCYFKQLKRKERECGELNERSVGFARKCQKLELDVCHLKDKNYNLQRQLDQLKAENKKLKKTLKEPINEVEDDRKS